MHSTIVCVTACFIAPGFGPVQNCTSAPTSLLLLFLPSKSSISKSCSRETKTACYNTLVRPIVEYASCVWDPHTSKATSKAESVQRSAARYVMNNYSRRSSVTTMIDELQWKTLQHRRAVSKVTMMYRITNQLIDIPDDQLVPLNTPTRGHRHSKRFLIPRSRTSLLKDTFFPNTIRLWNGLPEKVVNSPSIDIFKTRVRDVVLN